MDTVLIDRLLDALCALPDVAAATASASDRPADADGVAVDGRMELRVLDRRFHLAVETKGRSVYPRDVREFLWRVGSRENRASDRERSPCPLLAADALSPGAKELLRAERVGYFDLGGSLFVPIDGAYVYIDRPSPASITRSVRALFSGRRVEVIRALLARAGEWFGVSEVAERARVAPATVSEVVAELDRRDWLETEGRGPAKRRRLREPAAVLDAWASDRAMRPPVERRRFYVPEPGAGALPAALARALDAHRVPYALTGEAAAQRYAPFLSQVLRTHVRLTPGPDADAALEHLGARAVDEGANLLVSDARSDAELRWDECIEGVPPHAGTRDVDIVVDLEILADVEAYRTLEQNLRTVGFERAENARGLKLSWRWQVRTGSGALAILWNRFASDGSTEGYRKDGAVAVAKFELGETSGVEEREARALRQRGASERIERLLSDVGYPPGPNTETSA